MDRPDEDHPYRAYFDESPIGVFVADEAGTFVDANPRACEMLGYSREDLRSMSVEELLVTGDTPETLPSFDRVRETGHARAERQLVDADGERIDVFLDTATVGDDRYVTYVREITERKRRERDRARQRALLEAQQEAVLDGLLLVDENGDIVSYNDRYVELWGVPESIIDRGYDATLNFVLDQVTRPGTFRERVNYLYEHVEETARDEIDLCDGRVFDRYTTPLIAEDGTYYGRLWTFRDISERKEREQRIENLKERLELAITGAELAVWDWNVETDHMVFNDQWAEMLGLSPAAVGPSIQAWKRRIHPEDVDAVEAALDAHLAGDTDVYETEHRLRTADGDYKWIRDVGKVTERTDDGDPIRAVGIHIDIDERKGAEAALENARDRLRQVIDLVPDLIFVKNRDGEYLLANEAVADAYGRSVEEVIGRTEAELRSTEDDDRGFREDELAVIESGETKTIPEAELVTAEGETLVLQTIKIPYEPAGTEERALLGYARDVTELKEYERRIETQRDNLELINKIVRHDIRNDLQVVVSFAEALEAFVDEDGSDYLEQVLTAAREAVEITRTAADVTDVVLQADADRTPTHLRPTLESEIDGTRSNFESTTVTVDGSIPDATILADDMLGSVFRNLLQNAIVHNDSDRPTVTVSGTVSDGRVAIDVADDGPGVPDDRKDEIFEEGVQGLDSDGTGLGLYLVQTLVDRYDGTVSVDDRDGRTTSNPRSDPGEATGAVFTVELPTTE
jgi:PAS domain S-box-containing protein